MSLGFALEAALAQAPHLPLPSTSTFSCSSFYLVLCSIASNSFLSRSRLAERCYVETLRRSPVAPLSLDPCSRAPLFAPSDSFRPSSQLAPLPAAHRASLSRSLERALRADVASTSRLIPPSPCLSCCARRCRLTMRVIPVPCRVRPASRLTRRESLLTLPHLPRPTTSTRAERQLRVHPRRRDGASQLQLLPLALADRLLAFPSRRPARRPSSTLTTRPSCRRLPTRRASSSASTS